MTMTVIMPVGARRFAALGIALATAVVLSACGGGSSGNSAQSGLAAGTLDPGFGNAGTVLTPNSFAASGIALQPDGKIVVAAGNSVLRYTPNGVLDATFGAGGVVSGALATGEFASLRVALQPDGEIVAVGTFARTDGFGAYHCALVRYMTDGATDRGFGSDGLVVWDPNGNVSACTDVALQPDRSIVAGVQPGTVPSFGGRTARFRADGTLDTSFGVGGSVDGGGSIAIQPDGKIIATWLLRGHGLNECDLGRVDAAGVPDPGFGNGGTMQWKGPFDDQAPLACAMARQPDGKIVVANEGSVARFLENGTFDPGFGTGGVVTGIPGVSVAVQSNGKIVVVGGAGNLSPPAGFALWRLGVDGRLDPGFGNAGTVSTPLLDIGGAEAVAIQSDGKILAVGWAESRPAGGTPTGSTAALARYFGD